MHEARAHQAGARRSLVIGLVLCAVGAGACLFAAAQITGWRTAQHDARLRLEQAVDLSDPVTRTALGDALNDARLIDGALLLGAAGVAFGLSGGVLVARTRRIRLRQALHPSMVAAADRKIERILAEHAQDLVTMIDRDGRFTYVSPSVGVLLGYNAAAVLGQHPVDFIDDLPDRGALVVLLADLADLADGEPLRHRVRHADGTQRWFETLVHHIDDDRSTGVVTLFSSRDITERVNLEETLAAERRLLGDTLANVHAGILSVDLDGTVIDANAEFCTMVGFRPLPGTSLTSVEERYLMVGSIGDEIAHAARPMVLALRGETVKHFAATLTTEDGRQTDIVANAGPLVGSDGRRNGAILTLHDVSELRATEAELRSMASVDMLTGLPNRRSLVEALQNALERNVETPERLALLFLDLDGFKQVNDNYGHDVGDQLLVAVAGRLAGCVRGGDVVARLGGDEFIVLVDHLNEPSAVMLLVGRIERALTDPFPVPSGTVTIGVSVGVAMADAASTVEQLISDADRAMYERKRERSVASSVSAATTS